MLKGKVKIKPSNPKKAGIFTLFSSYKGEYNENVVLKNPLDGNEMVLRFNWDSYSEETLNLENPVDAAKYEWLLGHPFVKGDKPKLLVVNEQERVDKNLSYKRLLTKAYGIIDPLQGTKLANFARIVGLNTSNVSEDTLKNALYEKTDSNPEMVILEWEHKDRTYREMLKKGESKGIFNVNKAGIWKWKEHNMGINFEQAVEFLKNPENADIIPSINKELTKA